MWIDSTCRVGLSLTVVIMGVAAFTVQAFGRSWTEDALRLTGESKKIRLEAINRLRKTPNLNVLLKNALIGDEKFLALDVISALSFEALRPEVLRLSQEDDSGAFYLTLNTLITKKNAAAMAREYQARLMGRTATAPSIPAQAVMLDTLARMKVSLETAWLHSRFRSGEPEIQKAILYYVRHFLVRKEHSEYLYLVVEALSAKLWQVRAQALYLYKDLPVEFRNGLFPNLTQCMDDPNSEVRGICQRVRKGGT